jgi:hypothetical protein
MDFEAHPALTGSGQDLQIADIHLEDHGSAGGERLLDHELIGAVFGWRWLWRWGFLGCCAGAKTNC